MDNEFDKQIKERTKREEVAIPLQTKQQINKTLLMIENQQVKRKGYFNRRIAACMLICLTLVGNILAATDIPAKVIDGISGFFSKTDSAKYENDAEALGELEQYIGKTIEKYGIEITLESIAVDDNFLNLFYTMRSNEMIPKEGDRGDLAALYVPLLQIEMNGKPWEYMNNGQDQDAYLEDEKTLKVMERIDVAHLELPEQFSIDIMLTDRGEQEKSWIFSDILVQKIKEPSQNIIVNKPWKVVARTLDMDQAGNREINLNIDKVIISPLASQIVISEKKGEYAPFQSFALFDQDDQPLEIITQWTGTSPVEKDTCTNGFEFIPTSHLKKIKIIPITEPERVYEVKGEQIYRDMYQDYEEKYPIQMKIAINELPTTIERGPLTRYEFLEAYIEDDEMMLKFKINGPTRDQLLKTEIYPLDANDQWLMHSAIKSISIDRKTGIYTLRVSHPTIDNKKANLSGAKYLTLDDGGYLVPEQLLWDQAIEINIAP